jgi:hypothetical protein
VQIATGGWYADIPPSFLPSVYPKELLNRCESSSYNVLDSMRRLREEYRERALVQSASRLRNVSSRVTLDMTADMIESTWSLRDAGETAIVRRRR